MKPMTLARKMSHKGRPRIDIKTRQVIEEIYRHSLENQVMLARCFGISQSSIARIIAE